MCSKLEQARKVFSADRYASEVTGVVIEHVGDHEATCSLTLDGQHRNARGVAMGGVLFTLADFAAAVAANTDSIEGFVDKLSAEPTTDMGTPDNNKSAHQHIDNSLRWVSLDSSIHFLAPATGSSLRALCTPLKVGRTTALYQTIIENPDNGKRVAIVETTMINP